MSYLDMSEKEMAAEYLKGEMEKMKASEAKKDADAKAAEEQAAKQKELDSVKETIAKYIK